ncbi:hypothetical protein WJX84_005839 [Apatococcus fuscideae]|uniref:BZIP domain-containing protein n=1 Tax=Apatococcus fuscideae TaxID=2026836 RepID=A0AAW1SQB7_9CHLO
MAATHPYAGFWPNQPFMYGAPLAYGGLIPYPQFSAPAGDPSAQPAMQASGPVTQLSTQLAQATAARGSQAAVAMIQATDPQIGLEVQPRPAGTHAEQDLSSGDDSPSGELGTAASGLATSSGVLVPGLAGLPPHEEESRRAQEYWKRAAQPYAAGDTPRLGSGAPHDEREVKRQRRKQSNRESARRSRLRKQAECETLAQKVDALVDENARLRTLNKHLQEQLDKFIGGLGKVDPPPAMMYHPQAGLIPQAPDPVQTFAGSTAGPLTQLTSAASPGTHQRMGAFPGSGQGGVLGVDGQLDTGSPCPQAAVSRLGSSNGDQPSLAASARSLGLRRALFGTQAGISVQENFTQLLMSVKETKDCSPRKTGQGTSPARGAGTPWTGSSGLAWQSRTGR